MCDRYDFPPYTYVPGGPHPHPISGPGGHMRVVHGPGRSRADNGRRVGLGTSRRLSTGRLLFNAGYYWEAHEAWEGLWHAHGRQGPTADTLKGSSSWPRPV